VFKIIDMCRDETAATAIEYGLIAALISVAAVTVLTTVGSNLTNTFSTVERLFTRLEKAPCFTPTAQPNWSDNSYADRVDEYWQVGRV